MVRCVAVKLLDDFLVPCLATACLGITPCASGVQRKPEPAAKQGAGLALTARCVLFIQKLGRVSLLSRRPSGGLLSESHFIIREYNGETPQRQVSQRVYAMKKRKIMIPIILVALACLIIPGFNNAMKIQRYTVESDVEGTPVRIALIADLHSCGYGENQQELIDALEGENPDLVLMVGDIFDDELSDDNTKRFLQGIREKYPCYYVTGNHEYWSGREAFSVKMDILKECGVHRLSGACETVWIHGTGINLCGVDDPEASLIASGDLERDTTRFFEQIDQVKAASQNGNYTILLSHRPEFFELYAAKGFDLALCGHAHGGQFRIPGILNGLYAPNQGFFPRYAGGEYEEEKTTMIVSRGLARESTRIPRFYNRPELVMIDLI